MQENACFREVDPGVDISAQGHRQWMPFGIRTIRDMENTSRVSKCAFEQFDQFCTEFRNPEQCCTEFFSFACASNLIVLARGEIPRHHRVDHPVERVGPHISPRGKFSSCLLRGGSWAAISSKTENLRNPAPEKLCTESWKLCTATHKIRDEYTILPNIISGS